MMLTGFGMYIFLTLPKEQFPDIVVPTISVTTVYVGNSPNDIENLVTRPIEKMKKAALKAGCLACHSVEAGKGVAPAGTDKPVGPAWADVASKYRNKPGAADFLTRVVLEGSNPYSSHWKDKVSGIAMPPNAVAITEADARQLVFWILSIK